MLLSMADTVVYLICGSCGVHHHYWVGMHLFLGFHSYMCLFSFRKLFCDLLFF